MTPDGRGAAGVGLRWTLGWGAAYASSFVRRNKNDLRHYNSLLRLCPSPAMQKMGQQYCLIEVKDSLEILRLSSHKH